MIREGPPRRFVPVFHRGKLGHIGGPTTWIETDDERVNQIEIDVREGLTMGNSVTEQLRRMGWSEEMIARARINGKPVAATCRPGAALRSITFSVLGEPVARPRERARIVGKPGGKQFIQHYTPAKHPVNAYKAAIQAAYREASQCGALDIGDDDAVTLEVWCIFHRPACITRKTLPNPARRHRAKPDADNVAKSVMDALNELAWPDDAVVSDQRLHKRVAAGGQLPQTIIRITVESIHDVDDKLPAAMQQVQSNPGNRRFVRKLRKPGILPNRKES